MFTHFKKQGLGGMYLGGQMTEVDVCKPKDQYFLAWAQSLEEDI